MSHPEPSQEDVFSILGSNVRIEIIKVLADADRPLSFSELHDALEIRDSGQFNYHLNNMLETVVHRTDEGAYELTYTGGRIVGALYSGEFEPAVTAETHELASTCANCGRGLLAGYEDDRSQQLHIWCTGCEEVEFQFGFPPGGVEGRSPEELTAVLDRWTRTNLLALTDRVCMNCIGRLEGGLKDPAADQPEADQPTIELSCERCPSTGVLSVASLLYLHPEVVALYRRHGTDLDTIHLWNTRVLVDPSITTVDRDPWTLDASITVGDERLTLRIEEDLTIRPTN